MTSEIKRTSNSCPRCPHGGAGVRHGCFRRRSDRKWVQRWMCLRCGKTFSEATNQLEVYQKKRQFNQAIFFMLCSGVSQRRLSLGLNLHRRTIARKLKHLAIQARLDQTFYLLNFLDQPIAAAQFDEMETHEHTKLKPLSIALAVCQKSRKILGFKVSSMPSKGHLAKKSLKKYGLRRDDRPQAMRDLFYAIKPFLNDNAMVTSDQNPKYPGWLKPTTWIHTTIKGSRGSIGGQGELKKIGYDPIFSLNHTCAMLRANVNRLFRKTWCTTKKVEGLTDHLWLYMDFHNRILTS